MGSCVDVCHLSGEACVTLEGDLPSVTLCPQGHTPCPGASFSLFTGKERGDRHSEPQSWPRTQEASAVSETGQGSAGHRGHGWRPWWWASGRRALGRRGVEAAPKVEGTSGLGDRKSVV